MILTALLSSEPVEAVIALALRPDETAEGESRGGARDHLSALVDVGHGNLNRGVVLGLDDAASSGALAGHVQVDKVTLLDQREQERKHRDQQDVSPLVRILLHRWRHSHNDDQCLERSRYAEAILTRSFSILALYVG